MAMSARTISLTAALTGALALAMPAAGALGQTKISIARTARPNVFHIPAYIAMHQGLFKREGLEARFVLMTGKSMVTAGIRGAVDFVPNSKGGAQAALKGAQLRYVVGGATISRWAIMVERRIKSPTDLRNRLLAQGHAGSPGFGQGARVLREVFGLRLGRQYKAMSFPGDEARLAALIDGSVQAALLSFPYAARAQHAGFDLLLRTGAYLPRLDGAYWTSRNNLKNNRAAVAGFIRAIARAIEFLRRDRDGSTEIIRQAFGIRDKNEANFLRDMVHDGFSADIPDAPFRKMFEERQQDLASRQLWPRGKKLPDVERFVARSLLTATLRGMGYHLSPAPERTRKVD